MRFKPTLVAAVLALAAVPVTAQATPPVNNNYLPVAVFANAPGSTFPHNSPVQWTIPGNDATGDIDEATTQPNMGDPANTPEDLSCEAPPATFDRTVWYWVHPDVSGWLRVTTSGGDAVIRVVTVTGNNTPNFSDSACADDPTDISSEELFAGVTGGPGRKYAVQVGVFSGFGSWAMQHLTRITFFRDRDLDSVFDPSDRCPTVPGPASRNGCVDTDGDGLVDIDDRCRTQRGSAGLRGCPDGDGDGIPDIDDRCAGQSSAGRDANRNGCPDLRKFGANIVAMPNSTLFSRFGGRFVRNGVRITNLTVGGLPSGTRVQLTCSRRVCRKTVKRGRRVNFRKQLRGKKLRPGKSVVVRVSKSGYVTRRFVIKAKRRGRRGVARSNRCVVPGTRRLRACSRVSTIR